MSGGPRIVDATPSAVFLPESGTLRRTIRKPSEPTPEGFLPAYEDRALVYDAFHYDRDSVLLLGPPPMNLGVQWRAARFVALPSHAPLVARRWSSLSQLTVRLTPVPAGTVAVEMTFAGERYEIPVNGDGAEDFAGARLLTTMNQNNDLAWIRDWASHHARTQGTDSIVLFDNSSTRYGVGDIVETLRGINGLKRIAVPSWPWAFGRTDKRVKADPFWSHFLQNVSLNVVWRRFATAAHSYLNCDIDELTWAGTDRSVHDIVKAARSGFITFKGQWVESIPRDCAAPPYRHRDFTVRKSDPKARYHRNSKWALDPSRPWTRGLHIHPYWHWLQHRPLFSKERRSDVFYWHYRGINTNWKLKRAEQIAFDPAVHEIDPVLATLWGGPS